MIRIHETICLYCLSSWFWGIERNIFNGINAEIFHSIDISTCALITLYIMVHRVKVRVILTVNVQILKNVEVLEHMVGPGIIKIYR